MSTPTRSEGEQLAEILDELQREEAVRDIAGWDSGFPNLTRALDGIRPGLYLLIGSPGIGKTSFAKQLLDQIAMRGEAAGIFFTFAESKRELRIKTLARLSHMDSREIRRGSAYLLHWYGTPRLRGPDVGEISPSWEKLRLAAEQARDWLDSTYLIQCGADDGVDSIAARIEDVKAVRKNDNVFVIIDDCQRLGPMSAPLERRLSIAVEQLQALALNSRIPLLAVWPDLSARTEAAPEVWAEKVASADVIMVMRNDTARTQQLSEPNQAITLHIVKNRAGERGKSAFEFNPAFANFTEVKTN